MRNAIHNPKNKCLMYTPSYAYQEGINIPYSKKIILIDKVKVNKYFNKEKVEKNYKLPVLAISKENIEDNLALIKRNVFGIDDQTNKKIQSNEY